jgi:mannose/fructose/N-acetylgalactosamine-specific phosphotransferase system component IIC
MNTKYYSELIWGSVIFFLVTAITDYNKITHVGSPVNLLDYFLSACGAIIFISLFIVSIMACIKNKNIRRAKWIALFVLLNILASYIYYIVVHRKSSEYRVQTVPGFRSSDPDLENSGKP